MKINKFFYITSAVLFLAGCSFPYSTNKSSASPTSFKQSKLASNGIMSSRASEAAVYEDSVSFESADSQTSSTAYEKKIIKTGNVSIEVTSLSELENTVQDFATKYNGYITNSNMNETSFHITVKIPSANFETAINSAGDLGKIKNRSVSSEDVSDTYYDLQTRLETKKTMQKKLESYLSSAKNMSDLLEIEKQLNNVTSEIESMEGRMKRLTNQIDYSTIWFSFYLPSGYNNEGFDWPDLKEAFRNFGHNIVNFFASLLITIFYIIIYGIPVIAVTAFFFWLLFGRVGLLLKLFKWLKWKK